MELLPTEIISKILNYLSLPDQFEAGLINKKWHHSHKHALGKVRKLDIKSLSDSFSRNKNYIQPIIFNSSSLQSLSFTNQDFIILDPFKTIANIRHIELIGCRLAHKSLRSLREFISLSKSLETFSWIGNEIFPQVKSEEERVPKRKLGQLYPAQETGEIEKKHQRKSHQQDTFSIEEIFENAQHLQVLHLENAQINGYDFERLCRRLGGTLRKLCFRERHRRVSREKLLEGLSLLPKLELLDVNGSVHRKNSSVAGLFNAETLAKLPTLLPSLGTLNMRNSKKLQLSPQLHPFLEWISPTWDFSGTEIVITPETRDFIRNCGKRQILATLVHQTNQSDMYA